MKNHFAIYWQDKPALVLIVGIFLLQFIGLLFSVLHLPVTGDEAINMNMATDIAAGARPILFYGQPYQVPFEAYLFSWLTTIVEPGVAAARLPGWVLRQCGLLALVFAVLRLFKGWPRYIALSLLMLPAVYAYMLTAMYGIPQYSIKFFAFGVLTWLLVVIVMQVQASTSSAVYTLIAFAVAGLALSSYKLSLLYILPLIIVLSFYWLWQKRPLVLGFSYCLLGLGLIPYLLARQKLPVGPIDEMMGTLPLYDGLQKLFVMTLPDVLPRIIGVNAPVFPIWADDVIQYPKWFALVVMLVFLVAFGLLVYRAMAALAKWRINGQFLVLCYVLGCVLFSILAFSLYERSRSFSPRYMILLAWVLPLLLAYLYHASIPSWQKAVRALVAALLVFNVFNIAFVASAWQKPDFLARVADTPPLDAEIAQLKKRGIRHCFASYLYAHRLTYLTQGDIFCVQPYNERFKGWPYAHRDKMILSNEAVYLMTQTSDTLYPAYGFKQHLKAHQVQYQYERVGVFHLFYDFTHTPDDPHYWDAQLVIYKPGLRDVPVGGNTAAMRLVFNSRYTRPSQLQLFCDGKQAHSINVETQNFYFDGVKPLMFVDNQLVAIPEDCQNGVLRFLEAV